MQRWIFAFSKRRDYTMRKQTKTLAVLSAAALFAAAAPIMTNTGTYRVLAAQSSDVEEEANLCLALLMGYNATIYDDGDKEQKKQMVLNRICLVLEQLPASLLKVRLLTYTYGEVYEEVLFQEAYAIIEGWNKDNLSSEQTEIIEELKNIEENPYPFEEVE